MDHKESKIALMAFLAVVVVAIIVTINGGKMSLRQPEVAYPGFPAGVGECCTCTRQMQNNYGDVVGDKETLFAGVPTVDCSASCNDAHAFTKLPGKTYTVQSNSHKGVCSIQKPIPQFQRR